MSRSNMKIAIQTATSVHHLRSIARTIGGKPSGPAILRLRKMAKRLRHHFGKLDYKWVALSNTTLGMLVAMINSSILLIALPDIFRGIGVNPLEPGNTSYLLWLILGFLVVMAVLLVSLGRLGDMYGRVRMFNLGFAVFTVFSILLSLTWMQGTTAALWLI